MSDLDYIFPDTDVFLDEEETKVLKEIDENESGFAIIERDGENGDFIMNPKRILILNLLRKGYIDSFSYYNKLYILSKEHSNTRPVTLQFNIYFPKIISNANTVQILNGEEKDKMAFCRAFISKWVFKTKRIKDKEYLGFVKLHTTRMSYLMSMPKFLVSKFEKDIEKTGMTFKILTSEYRIVSCSYCRTTFDSKELGDMVKCPSCKAMILVR